MNPLFIPAITKLVDKTLEKVLPDKDAREKARLEFEKAASDIDQKQIDSFRQFVVDYEGTGDKIAEHTPIIMYLRGSVRPVLTYVLAGAYLYCFMQPTTFTPDVMEGLYRLNLISLGFWYGERALKNLGLNLRKS
jgi:hypothetical protein